MCLTFLVQTAAWPGSPLSPFISLSRGFLFSALMNCASASKSLVVTLTYVFPGRVMMSNLHTLVCELYSVMFFCCIGELAQYMRLAFFPLSLILFSFSCQCGMGYYMFFLRTRQRTGIGGKRRQHPTWKERWRRTAGRRSNKNMVKARTLAQARSEDQWCCRAWREQLAKM